MLEKLLTETHTRLFSLLFLMLADKRSFVISMLYVYTNLKLTVFYLALQVGL